MRRVISISLLLSLVIPITAIITHFQIEQRNIRKAVKHRMLEGIDHHELERLAFHVGDVDDLEWKHSLEFEYRAQFYDIVSTEYKRDSIIYFCWWDNDETALHKKLDALMASLMQRDPVQQQKQTRIADFFRSLYCTQLIALAAKPVTHQTLSYPDKTLHLYLPDDSPPVPPPESSSHIMRMI